MKAVTKKIKTQKIKQNILIAELIETYPEVIDFLVNKYEFHCVTCVLAGFETLKEGAAAHGITGKDFKKMMNELNLLVQ
jgi:hybrid cluster-associated redox disulfide protein